MTVRCLVCRALLGQDDEACSRCGRPRSEMPDILQDVGGAARDPVPEELRAATEGEYEILGVLGRGGFATVYLAEELALGRHVAIKVMAPEHLDSPDMAARFRREAATVANLRHDNIVRIHRVREAGTLSFHAMEYVRGRALDVALREAGRLPFDVVRAIVCQVGSALRHAHDQGVVHRDITPGNILLDREGRAVVTDFGIAKVLAEASRRTRTAVMGTPSYMSPEQIEGKGLSGASDQYSLGVVAYHMVTGRVPFTGTWYTVCHGHQSLSPPPIEGERPDCPGVLRDVILRMLAKEPADRWPSMGGILAALGGPIGEDHPVLGKLARLADPTAGVGGATRPLRRPERPGSSPGEAAGSRESGDPRAPDSTPGEERRSSTVRYDPAGPSSPAPPSGPSDGPTDGPKTARYGTSEPPSPVSPAGRGEVPRDGELDSSAGVAPPGTASGDRKARRRIFAAATVGVVVLVALGALVADWPLLRPGTPGDVDSGPVVARLEVDPPETRLTAGDRIQATLLAFDTAGERVPVPADSVVWAVSDTTVVRASAVGLLVGVGAGHATVGSIEARASIEVLAQRVPVATVALGPDTTLLEGDEARFLAVPRDEAGGRIDGREVTWSVDDPERADIAPSGELTALAPGEVSVRAEVEGVSGTRRVRIEPRPASLRMEPAMVSLVEGGSEVVAVTLLDGRGQPLAAPGEVRWEGPDSVADVLPDGSSSEAGSWRVQALAPGEVTFSATADGVTGLLTVHVTEAERTARRIVLPPIDSLSPGDSVRLEPEVLDDAGEPVERVVRWEVDPPGAGRVGESGYFRADSAGRVRVVARADDVSDTLELTIVAAGPLHVRFAGLAAGGRTVCGISLEEVTHCWGERGVSFAAPTLTFEQLSVGPNHACGVSLSGRAYCWGDNSQGQLGDGSTEARPEPTAVDGPTFAGIAVGGEHTCGVTVGGAIYCWGINRNGQIGNGSERPSNRPQEVEGTEGFGMVVAGHGHTCGLARNGEAFCWGNGFAGQVGYGTISNFYEPRAVAGGLMFRTLTAGREHSCGLTTENVAYCWGANEMGQLGDGTDGERREPERVAIDSTFSSLHSGDDHVCGLTPGGSAYCWGEDEAGSPRLEPTAFAAGTSFRFLALGRRLTCGTATDGRTLCWGVEVPGSERSDGASVVRIER